MIKSVKVVSGCISCRNCETVCPKIFRVAPTSNVISENFVWNETEILMAEAMCPVNVIKVEKQWGITLSFKESTLIDKKYLTSDILEITLEKPKNFSFKPGQYVSLMFEDWKGKFSRQYSIAYDDEKVFTLTIRLWEKWRWAAQLKKLKIWKKVKFLWPLGHFYLQNNKKEKFFISTWTGLAPFIAMGKYLGEDVKWHFVIWWRTSEEFYYSEKLKNFKNCETHYFTSQEETDFSEKWRVTNFLPRIPKENSEVYLCGNPEMVKAVYADLEAIWYPKENIFSEWFTPSWRNDTVLKEIFVNGNIPFVKEISWGVILFSFLLFALTIFKTGNSTLFDNFLFFGWYQGFIFNLSWFAVAFVMLIRPISDIFPKNNFLRKLKTFRKTLWILSSILIVATFTWKWFFDPNSMVQYFTNINRWNNFNALIPRISELTAFILLITSNTFSQKNLWKWWKVIQYLSYAYFITWAINAVSNSDKFFGVLAQYYWIVGIWIILLIIALVLNIKRKKENS